MFQKTLSRVVPISGPLHIAFHMLQSIYIVYKDMMKWSQKVVNWKKINVNKVSETFDTCRQLCMIILEEIERLVVDLFIIEHAEDLSLLSIDTSLKSMGVVVAGMYNGYISTVISTDDRRVYMFRFITMATAFRNYWLAVRSGDRVTMEGIQNEWIGVHLLVGKHKCVENCLDAIDLEYKNIDNITLQEIRMNISCRYHEGLDRNGNAFPLHPLDEVQENINCWTKRILLGPDEVSWKIHSPNVACAHMCVNYEESEYIKGSLDYSDLNNPKEIQTHRSSKTTVPTKTIEKVRLYEWCLAMFKDEVSNRECLIKDGFTIIDELKTKIDRSQNVRKNDDLELTMNAIFRESDETEIEPEGVEVIIDDYNGYEVNTTNRSNEDNTNVLSNETDDNNTITRQSQSVPKLSLLNVFEEGRKKMIELNIPKQRERKKDRLKRTTAFFLEIHEIVTMNATSIQTELDSITNSVLFNPWYRCSYRSAMK